METSAGTIAQDSDAESTLTRINRLDQLPVFPASASAVMNECNNSDAKVKRIIELIECDPAICTKVLSMANSPLYGSSRPVGSVGQAVVLLGMKSVSQLAVSVAANSVFSEGDASLECHRKKAFAQSLSCATLARLIARQTRVANPDEAFLSGVVHDVGKLVFFKIVPEVYSQILENDPSGQTIDAELQLIGVGHAEVGKNCGVRWGLPLPINEVIADHHSPIGETQNTLSQTVISANYFARQWQVGFGETETSQADENIEHAFSSHDLASLQDEFRDQYAAVEEIYLA
jgi:HD-like signal output (HDOD) protein